MATEITLNQRKQQGAVFTLDASTLVEAERRAGHTSDPNGLPYWEDSAGSGNLVIALARAMFEDMSNSITDPEERLCHIFTKMIYMNDVDDAFLNILVQNLNSLVRDLTGNPNFVCNFNIAQADTIDPEYNPHKSWGFEEYRTITNRSYQQISDLNDASQRAYLRSYYQERVYPSNAKVGKRIKITDCGQYKAINDPCWMGGPDLRPSNIPKTLQTEDIRLIDYRRCVRTMFSQGGVKLGAGIDVVVLQYDREWSGPVRVLFGEEEERIFNSSEEAWTFYSELTTFNFTTPDSQKLLERIKKYCTKNMLSYCKVYTTGATTGNKKELVGNKDWMAELIAQKNLEPQAFVKWLDVDSIIPGGAVSSQFALLPYQRHKKALEYYLSKVPKSSAHAVPAEQKSLPLWQKVKGPTLYFRYHYQYNADSTGLAVGYSNGFSGIGQTGSVMMAGLNDSLFGERKKKSDYILILLAVLNSSYGDFMKGQIAKQHKAVPTIATLGANVSKIPLPDLDNRAADKLIPLARQIIKTNTFDRKVLDDLVYKCMPFLSAKDKEVISDYLTRRKETPQQ